MAAAQYTKQYFPEFQEPILNPSLFISPDTNSILQPSVQNPIGIGLSRKGLESSLNANIGEKSSRKSIFIASILILGLVGTGGYFLYDGPTEPDFYGEIYWSESEIGIIFEEDGYSIGQPLVNGSCDIYQDDVERFRWDSKTFFGLHQKSNDICKHYFDSDKYSSEYKGDYFAVCGASQLFHSSCLEIYVFEHGIITKEQGVCGVHVSDINAPPSLYESFDENGHLDDADYEKGVDIWLEDWYEVVEEIMDDDDAPSCFYDFMNDDYDFPSDTFIFTHSAIGSDLSNEGGEGLVYVHMIQAEGDFLSQDLLSVSIVVDGGASLTCQEYTLEWEDEYDENAACTWDVAGEDGEDIWEAGDSISISEGPNTNLCDGSDGRCTVEITLTKIGVGGENNRAISQISAFAENIEHVDS